MKLSVSNIAWSEEDDFQMYEFLAELGISGLEMAPTRIFAETPYDKVSEIASCSRDLSEKYGLMISSIQSIWYGVSENMFITKENRLFLLEYTKKAIEFASAAMCNNIVFGCPKNRKCYGDFNAAYSIAVEFFHTLGEYATEHGTVVSMEANPKIYGTDFITTTPMAIQLVKDVNSRGFKVNLDVGTMICNEEDSLCLGEDCNLINHVHISEPYLVPVEKRPLHEDLRQVLTGFGYEGYISLETKNNNNIQALKNQILYMKSVFGGE